MEALLFSALGFILGYLLCSRTVAFSMLKEYKLLFTESTHTFISLDILLTYLTRRMGVSKEELEEGTDKIFKELYERKPTDE